jgi:hypothetical protein
VAVDGTVIPGLRASFYRRANGERTETIGLYRSSGRDLFVAWGYVGEPHCRYNAVHRDPDDPAQDADAVEVENLGHDGAWYATRRGCPVLHPIQEDGEVVGVTILAGRLLVPFRLTEAS